MVSVRKQFEQPELVAMALPALKIVHYFLHFFTTGSIVRIL